MMDMIASKLMRATDEKYVENVYQDEIKLVMEIFVFLLQLTRKRSTLKETI